jgi:hypothetical protein
MSKINVAFGNVLTKLVSGNKLTLESRHPSSELLIDYLIHKKNSNKLDETITLSEKFVNSAKETLSVSDLLQSSGITLQELKDLVKKIINTGTEIDNKEIQKGDIFTNTIESTVEE